MKKTTVTLTLYGDGVTGLLKHFLKLEDDMENLEDVEINRQEV